MGAVCHLHYISILNDVFNAIKVNPMGIYVQNPETPNKP